MNTVFFPLATWPYIFLLPLQVTELIFIVHSEEMEASLERSSQCLDSASSMVQDMTSSLRGIFQ